MLVKDDPVTNPKVIVVCAWYNRPDYIKKTVDSLLNQDYSNFEVVIINDGSTDKKVKVILDKYQDPRLTIIHQDNKGFTNTIKIAIDLKDSPYVAVMGAGDVVKKDKLSKQIRYLEKHKNVGALGCGHTLVSATYKRNLGYVKPIQNLKQVQLKNKVPFTQGTVVYRREVLYRAGHYDVFFKNAQDRDLYWRILNISEIHAINENLYEKLIFEDGVSFRPDIIVTSNFYVELAKNQNREVINFYKNNPDRIPNESDIHSPKYFKYTIKRTLAFIIRREFKLAKIWSVMATKQALNFSLKNKTTDLKNK